jgi:hypothetical protein
MSEQTAPQQIPGTENPNSHPETVNGIPAPDATDISMTDAPTPTVVRPSFSLICTRPDGDGSFPHKAQSQLKSIFLSVFVPHEN